MLERSRQVGQMQGVTQFSSVPSRRCCTCLYHREYRDVSSHAGLPTGAAYPTRDEDGNLLTTEFGLCVYKNHQTVIIQARGRA